MNPREEFSFADRGKLIAELRAENERLWRIEEAARANYDAMARHYGDEPAEWWPQLYAALNPDVATEPSE